MRVRQLCCRCSAHQLDPVCGQRPNKNPEDNLGLSLFTRSARAITLNPQGTRVLPIAKEILALYSTMQLSTDTDIASYYGQLRIGSINSVQVGILPEALKAITLLAPLMQTEIVPGRAVELFEKLEVGEIDAAITIQPAFALPKDIVTQSIMTEPYVLISPKNGPFIASDKRLSSILLSITPYSPQQAQR
ncbi:hypothetical protein PKHYL_10850 [Psychrobacter sp. KH172YL61]|nr:LysR substrate-binding domain-containing protein [Psychrobacter sp. KH172YL61]BBI66894.1 hypothetical protein PKHYL_10850 [Psychrobacter sp. KH172YL61]